MPNRRPRLRSRSPNLVRAPEGHVVIPEPAMSLPLEFLASRPQQLRQLAMLGREAEYDAYKRRGPISIRRAPSLRIKIEAKSARLAEMAALIPLVGRLIPHPQLLEPPRKPRLRLPCDSRHWNLHPLSAIT